MVEDGEAVGDMVFILRLPVEVRRHREKVTASLLLLSLMAYIRCQVIVKLFEAVWVLSRKVRSATRPIGAYK